MKAVTIIAITLAVTTATSAFAQTQTKRTRAQTATMMQTNLPERAGTQAYAFVPGASDAQQPGLYMGGRYVGWDPDPNIRLQLLREVPDTE